MKRSSLVSSFVVLASISLVAVAGCGGSGSSENIDSDTQQLSDDGNEAVASQQQSVDFAEYSFSITSATPEIAAGQMAGPMSQLWPSGCASRQKDPTNPRIVHIHFDDCTGPFGLRHLSGDETAVLSKNADGSLHMALSDDGDLTVNGKPVQHSAAADISIEGAMRNVAWKGAWNRTNAKNEAVAHSSDLAIVVDTTTHCRTTNGTGVTTVGAREVDTQIKDVEICRKADGDPGCPSGTVIHTRKASGKSITVEFDGSAVAQVTTPKGTFDVPLVCIP